MNKSKKKERKPKNKTVRGGKFSFFHWIQTKKERKGTNSIVDKKGKKETNIPTIIRFHSKYCGHCEELNEIWPTLVKKKSSLFQFIDVDENEFEKGRLKELNKKFHVKMVVDGYPTIYKIINNRLSSYEKNRDILSLLKWMV